MAIAPDEPPRFETVDPYALARNEAKAAQLKRFYKNATVAERADGFALLLDDREARTPARAPIVVPSRAAGEQLAAEWNQQGDIILPGDMVTTRLVNSVIDGVARAMDPVRAEIVRFAGSDLVCYRAEGPADLVSRQSAAWDPVVAWARDDLHARLFLAEGIMHVAQPDHAMAAIDTAIGQAVGHGEAAPFRLGSLHVMTTLSGSAVLALGVLMGAFAVEDAWAKAHVDEDFQADRWGLDEEAAERRARRWRDMAGASALAEALPLQP